MKQTSHWLLVLCCGVILTVEAPLVFASLAADFEGAYPTWEATQASAIEVQDELPEQASQSFGFVPVSSSTRPAPASSVVDEPWVEDRLRADDLEAIEMPEPLLSLGF